MDVMKFARANWDRVLGWGGIGVGMVILVIGWFGISGSSLPAEQLPYVISGGLGGLLCVAVGATLLLSADLGDEWRKLDEIRTELRQLRATGVDVGEPLPDSEPQSRNGRGPRTGSKAVQP